MLTGDHNLLPIVQRRKLSPGKGEELNWGHTVTISGWKVKMAPKTRQTRPSGFFFPTLRKVLALCLALLMLLSSESSEPVWGESIL